MKLRFTATLLVIFICIFYTNTPAIANALSKEGELVSPDNIEGCMRSCLSDYSKIAKCDINEMMREYILELEN